MAKPREVYLYGIIADDPVPGDGYISPRAFAEAIAAANGEPILLRVNSPGGSVTAGLAMYNALRGSSSRVTARVEGMAASAASVVIQGAAEVEIASAAYVMIHRASGLTMGNADDHLQTAAILELDDRTIAGIYAARSGRDPGEYAAAMDLETWYTGDDAVAFGLADRLVEWDAARPAVAQAVAWWQSGRVATWRRPPAGLTQADPASPVAVAVAAVEPVAAEVRPLWWYEGELAAAGAMLAREQRA